MESGNHEVLNTLYPLFTGLIHFMFDGIRYYIYLPIFFIIIFSAVHLSNLMLCRYAKIVKDFEGVRMRTFFEKYILGANIVCEPLDLQIAIYSQGNKYHNSQTRRYFFSFLFFLFFFVNSPLGRIFKHFITIFNFQLILK
jgi:hypothetical protein